MKDLFGNPASQRKGITLNLYHDERKIPSQWFYHSFCFVPVENENKVLEALIHHRKQSAWEKEIHFKDIDNTRTENDLAVFEQTGLTPNGGPPLHIHPYQDEWFYVIEGEYLFQVGEDKYSFDFYVSQEDTTKTINVIFYENVNVQDQVGEISCVYEPQNITSKFCEDNLFDDNGTHILSFSCEAIVPLF